MYESVEETSRRAAGYDFILTDRTVISSLLKSRDEDSHKGTYGHALLIAGSTGMMGAAVLATGGALKSGCGLVTVHVPFQERQTIHISHPSAIVDCDQEAVFSVIPDNLMKYRAIGAGCGLGQSPETSEAIGDLLLRLSGNSSAPATILDADALNIISSHPEMFRTIPRGSVLTPHLGELSRLVSSAVSSGIMENRCYPWTCSADITVLARSLAETLGSIVVVKGPGTMICPPSGQLYFNGTGNPGMAKGGSGDVLTGLITGLCARGYAPLEAAILGVWFHGKAGDDAAASIGMESMCASDISDNIHVI